MLGPSSLPNLRVLMTIAHTVFGIFRWNGDILIIIITVEIFWYAMRVGTAILHFLQQKTRKLREMSLAQGHAPICIQAEMNLRLIASKLVHFLLHHAAFGVGASLKGPCEFACIHSAPRNVVPAFLSSLTR